MPLVVCRGADTIMSVVVCRRAHVLLMLFVFVCVQWCPMHIVLCLFLLPSSCYVTENTNQSAITEKGYKMMKNLLGCIFHVTNALKRCSVRRYL